MYSSFVRLRRGGYLLDVRENLKGKEERQRGEKGRGGKCIERQVVGYSGSCIGRLLNPAKQKALATPIAPMADTKIRKEKEQGERGTVKRVEEIQKE